LNLDNFVCNIVIVFWSLKVGTKKPPEAFSIPAHVKDTVPGTLYIEV
jgi:hypothetical protein